MRVRVTIEFDTKTGDYEVQYNNLSQPGQPIDFAKVSVALDRVLGHHSGAVESGDAEEGTFQ